MARHTQFHRKLDKLWKRRTDDLRALIKPKVGTRLRFTRKLRNDTIKELLEIAADILTRKVARHELDDLIVERKRRRIRGRGLDGRGKDLVAFSRQLRGPIIYMFRQGKQCLYVGKGRKPSRLASYQRHAFSTKAGSVEVFSIPSKSQLPKAECLATHLLDPRHNRVRPARVKWSKKCPVCRRLREIKHVLSALFPLR